MERSNYQPTTFCVLWWRASKSCRALRRSKRKSGPDSVDGDTCLAKRVGLATDASQEKVERADHLPVPPTPELVICVKCSPCVVDVCCVLLGGCLLLTRRARTLGESIKRRPQTTCDVSFQRKRSTEKRNTFCHSAVVSVLGASSAFLKRCSALLRLRFLWNDAQRVFFPKHLSSEFSDLLMRILGGVVSFFRSATHKRRDQTIRPAVPFFHSFVVTSEGVLELSTQGSLPRTDTMKDLKAQSRPSLARPQRVCLVFSTRHVPMKRVILGIHPLRQLRTFCLPCVMALLQDVHRAQHARRAT